MKQIRPVVETGILIRLKYELLSIAFKDTSQMGIFQGKR